jgi:hypothetical protein
MTDEPTQSQPASPPHESAGDFVEQAIATVTSRFKDGASMGLHWKQTDAQLGFARAVASEAIAAWNKRTPDLQAENARLRGALEDVVNPLNVLKREAERAGCSLNGMAYSIANDLHFVQNIARLALSTKGEG